MLKYASRTAVLAAAVTAVMMPGGVAFAADSPIATTPPAASSGIHGKDIGAGLQAVVKGGRLVVTNIGSRHVLVSLKPGETYDRGVYVKFNADGRTFSARTQGGHHRTADAVAPRESGEQVGAGAAASRGKDIGGGMEAVVKGGRLTITSTASHQTLLTLKPGQVFDDWIYVKFNTDGKTFTTHTQGDRHGQGKRTTHDRAHTRTPKSDTTRAPRNKVPQGAVAAGAAPTADSGADTALPVTLGGAGAIALLGGGAAVLARRKAARSR
ncbi:hypothetical protein [Streptomyces sp. NPDC047123]|uniref:hypothetical protein n=1 Tax=Streptomyces sp. NPDC047123 TaxID=3155622 RepID=UPI0033E8BF18